MAGVVNPSMPVWVARDEATGKVAWAPLNEGSGAVLRYGADGPEVLERLKWMRDVLAPELQGGAVGARTARPLRPARALARARRRGAPPHRAGHRADAGGARHRAPRGARVHRRQRPVLPQPGDGLLQARAGLRGGRAGLAGPHRDRPQRRRGRHPRLRARRPVVRRPGRAARPGEAVRRLHAGRHEPGPRRLRDRRDLRPRRAGRRRVAARRRRRSGSTRPTIERIDAELRAIAAGESPDMRFPDGRAAILGVDARKVAATRISPPVHTGIAHRQPGVGQIGGGITHPPLEAFDLAVEALVDARRGGPPRAARRAARGRVPVRAAARRGAARRALRDQPHAGARGAAPAGGRRARRPRPLRRRAARTRRGCRRCASSTTCASCSRTSRCAPPIRSGSTG